MAVKPASSEKPRKSRILLVDCYAVVRRGLHDLIAEVPDMVVCGEVDSLADALRAVDKRKPDVMVIDIGPGDFSAIDLVADCKAQHRSVKVVVLTLNEESLYVERFLRAGADGYVTMSERADEVIEAIRRVLGGEVYLNGRMASLMFACMLGDKRLATDKVHRLSNRELQVFEMMGRGMSTREIAQKLHLSMKTIESHREHIKKKLHVDDASHLLHQAFLWTEGHANSEAAQLSAGQRRR